MKRFLKGSLSLMLALVMLFQAGEAGIAFAVEEVDKAVNPAEHIELTVPEQFRDGGSWFFIPEHDYAASEKSTEKIYVPIQRTGETGTEADVTLKVTDLSARHDVNYTVEIYKEDLEPEIIFNDVSIVDIALNSDGQEEIEPIADENELGELIYEAGGAELVDGDGNVVASVTATPLDENGNPVEEPEDITELESEELVPVELEPGEEESQEARRYAVAVPGEAEETEWTEGAEKELSATDRLRAAREAYTGTVSDRQKLSGGDLTDLLSSRDGNTMTEEEYNRAMADAVVDDYPGKEYRLHFGAGEEAKFLVITPMYSDKAEGDAQIMLMLKDPGEGYGIGEDVNPVSVTIYDEDEPEPVYISMAEETVCAQDGKATVTVTRSGRLNAIKGVRLASWGGTAKEGDEYSGVGANLYFPMGIQSRSVDIPVYHGDTQKDFYLTITALSDEIVEEKTVHVIIPAAADGELMDEDTAYTRVRNRKVTSPINLKDGYIRGDGAFNSDTSFWISTPEDTTTESWYALPTADLGYAYDGVHAEYHTFVNWCYAKNRLYFKRNGRWTTEHTNDFHSDGNSGNHWLQNNWGDPKAPDEISFGAENTKNTGAAWTDSYIITTIDAVYLIKRQFNIHLEDPEVKPLIGVSDADVLNYYETVNFDNDDDNIRTVWTDEAVDVTASVKRGPLRLAGLEAKTADGKWVRIVTIDGKSATASLTLSKDNINALAALNVITWKKVAMYNWEDSYQGEITIRPVFDYVNVPVDVADHEYGNLRLQAPNPTLLWDFNSDNAMASRMGVNWAAHQVSYTGGRSGSDDYFTFTASGDDPYISVETPVADASDALWVKIRARTSSSAPRMQLFASVGSVGRSLGNTCVNIPVTGDGQWHEYLVQITNKNWAGAIRWLRIDPIDGCRNGDTVDVDYVAFFPDEDSANAFRSGDGFTSTPGSYTYHLGDVVTFTTVSSEKGEAEDMLPDGFKYTRRKGGRDGEFVNASKEHYLSNDNPYEGSLGFALNGKDSEDNIIDGIFYRFEPEFTKLHNSITVLVSEEYYSEYMDTSRGLFAECNNVSVEHDERNRRYIIVVNRDILTNDIYELTAYTKNPGSVIPKWITADGREFFGDTFYVLSSPRIEDNVITLEAASGRHLTYVTLTGSVTTTTFNLTTQRSASDAYPVQDALVSYGSAAAWTDENGSFTLPGAIYYDSDAAIRFTVTYNGVTTIQEAKVPSRYAAKHDAVTLTGETVKAVTADAGVIKVANYTTQTAHVDHIEVKQDGKITGYSTGLPMNGQRLTVNAYIAQGQDYAMNGKTYSEHITDVTLYFMDQLTGEVHGMYSSNVPAAQQGSNVKWSYDAKKGVFTLRITSFDPEHPTEWTYGDVLMVRITSDRKSGVSAMTENQSQKQVYDMEQKKYVAVDVDDSEKLPMVYVPVSSGLAVVADPDYAPKTFQYDLDNLPDMLQIESPTNEDGELLDGDTRYSFGSFPYIGEITAGIHVFTKVVSSAFLSTEAQMIQDDLENMAPNSVSPGMSGEGYSKQDTGASLSAFFNITETVYGGVRFMIGVVMSYGGGKGYETQKNPYRTARDIVGGLSIYGKALEKASESDLIVTAKPGFRTSQFGGTYFKVMTFLGLYLDYGYASASKNDGAEVSHDMIFMGAGGFIGFNVTAGFTKPFAFMVAFVPIPAYFNVEAGIKGTLFLGSEGNPQKTLQSFYTEPEMKGQDFSFNFEFQGRIYATGTIGVGIYKVVGARVSASVGFEFGYSNSVQKWWPNLFDSGWGYTIEATFAGTLDLIYTTIDVYSATWPTPWAAGFLYYFQEVRRANKCILYVENGLNDPDCEASESEMARAREMVDELKAMVDANTLSSASEDGKIQLYDVETVKNKTSALKDYAYEHDIISWVVKNTIEMNKQGGIAGSAINAAIEDDGIGLGYHTSDHVDSVWVAGNGELMSGYGVVGSTALVENAYAQPSSKIISIGSGKYLMVFLDDTASRDRMQAATLKWTVYNANNDTWTIPKTVQDDATADSRPSLTDAGDKIILSWASATDAKYDKLRSDVAAELAAAEMSSTDLDVQEALEADPARAMSIMDVFSVEFDKSSETFGTITQLTDDDYYDDYPQAVYDSDTKDYIVIYYKTAQDTDSHKDAAERLMDLVSAGPDPEKTYSVVAYMLYNGTEKVDNGEIVPVGWMTDHMFANEMPAGWTSDEFIAKYGPERFLESVILTVDGKYADPPVNDLTVAPGYNGLAAYAYTVDKDFDMSTAEDRELYVQLYDFVSHSTFVPIKVGGTTTAYELEYDSDTDDFVQRSYQKEVEVGTPRLVRNGGNTFLFWREDGDTLKYLNVSEMLNAKVATKAAPGPDDWDWAVRADGTYAADAVTGPYEPKVMKVDFGSTLTADAIEITDYEVISDEEDNLYVVWTDAVTHNVTNEIGETYPVAAQEIYASGMIRQDKQVINGTDENGDQITNSTQTVRWSKPYRLTRDNAFNDGLALALDPDGNLLIVHNQYSKKTAQSETELMQLIAENKIGVTEDKDGQLYAATLTYNSPVSLMVTRMEKIGSVEATQVNFSDAYPVAGETVTVTAALENVGLTNAEGFEVNFYECKDSQRGRLIATRTSDETFVVNTAKSVTFNWNVPEDGPEGYAIEAEVREKNGSGSYYDAVSTFTDAFTAEPVYSVEALEAVQEGDRFRVKFTAANEGNADAPEGTGVSVRLVGLYGDLSSDRYGNLESAELYSGDVTAELKAKTLRETTEMDYAAFAQASEYNGDVLVDIPASVFSYCGYDAVQVVITDKNCTVLAESDQCFVSMDQPVNLSLNEGAEVSLSEGSSEQVSLSYDTTVFVDDGKVAYSVEDPSVATVDENGSVTGLSEGTTTLTATLIPSGRSVSVPVTVKGSGSVVPIIPVTPADPEPTPEPQPCDRGESCPMTGYSDLDKSAWYHDGVHWALEKGVMNGVGADTFRPDGETTRAMLVTMLYRMENEPAADYDMDFTDVAEGKWYTEAIRWAAANGIVLGYGDGTFRPDGTLTREQLATILYRYAKTKGQGFTGMWAFPLRYDDASEVSDWAYEAVCWMTMNGVINGVGENRLSPKGSASRAQVATMLVRYEAIER